MKILNKIFFFKLIAIFIVLNNFLNNLKKK